MDNLTVDTLPLATPQQEGRVVAVATAAERIVKLEARADTNDRDHADLKDDIKSIKRTQAWILGFFIAMCTGLVANLALLLLGAYGGVRP